MPSQKINTLQELKKIKLKKENKCSVQHTSSQHNQYEKKSQACSANDEQALFLQAMHGVDPFEDKHKQHIHMHSAQVLPQKTCRSKQTSKKHIFQNTIELNMEYAAQYMHGYVQGLDSKIFQKLKNGSYTYTAQLDLHGMHADQALDSLLFFVQEAYLQGKQCLLLITGRGLSSPGGQSILRQTTFECLTRDPLRSIILAFVTALPRDGGSGALYLLLRKKK